MGGLFAEKATAPGLLVTLDGPNASGKTTLGRALGERLSAAGVAVHLTREPSSSALGEFARASEDQTRGRALACLVAADRHQHVETEIAAHLARGEVVISDRYVESSLVLQCIDGVELEFILAINAGILRPDVRFVLRADPEILAQRLVARATRRRFESMPDGSATEAALYEQASALLERDHGAPATTLDTSGEDPSVPLEHAYEAVSHTLERTRR